MTHEIIYAIVQFRPYLETEEFANVGVVLCAPKSGYFDYIIELRRFKRLTGFFVELPRDLAKNATHYIAHELERIKKNSYCENAETLQRLFTEITKHREGIIHYSPPRVGIIDEAPKERLKSLFEHHVNHSFAVEKSPNQRLEAMTRELLEKNNLGHMYKAKEISDDEGLVKANVPFVYGNSEGIVRAIRPLSLKYETPSAIIEAGDKWVNRFKRLFSAKKLEASTLVMPLEFKHSSENAIKKATEIVNEDIASIGIHVIDAEDTRSLIRLATIGGQGMQ